MKSTGGRIASVFGAWVVLILSTAMIMFALNVFLISCNVAGNFVVTGKATPISIPFMPMWAVRLWVLLAIIEIPAALSVGSVEGIFASPRR